MKSKLNVAVLMFIRRKQRKGIRMCKYKISREFFLFSHFTPPISEKFLAMAVPHMKTPKSIFRDKELDVSRHKIESYDGAD